MTAALLDASRRVTVVQGECHVSDDAGLCLTTLLGSCVAACLTDPVAGVGGMNHFLLPGSAGDGIGQHSAHAMELLVQDLLQRGARRSRLQAKLFGGARMVWGLADVGASNAEFAVRFVRRERIAMGPSSLGGVRGRRVHFWPVNGRVLQQAIGHAAPVFAAERQGDGAAWP